MTLIFIDGGPAAGKNTLGELLISNFSLLAGKKSVLLDMGRYIEHYCPKWVWNDPQREISDRLQAEIDMAKDIDESLQRKLITLVIGVRILNKESLTVFMKKIKTSCPVHLYHLVVPFELREQRLHQRGPHSIIDLAKDQKDRDAVSCWPGFVYNNVNTPVIDASALMEIILNGDGLISW